VVIELRIVCRHWPWLIVRVSSWESGPGFELRDVVVIVSGITALANYSFIGMRLENCAGALHGPGK